MTAASRELFRNNLLHQLDSASPIPMRVPALKIGARTMGFDPSDREIDAELQYLADKELATTVDKTLSPENKHWRITGAGRDYVAANPLG